MAHRFSRSWLSFLLAGLAGLCWIQTWRLGVTREEGLLSIDPPTPYVRYLPQSSPAGTMLVVHGLSSSKDFMQLFCAGMAEAGFDVYAIDLPGHGSSYTGFEATLAEGVIEQSLKTVGNNAVVVGHSLGAGLLLDLATRHNFKQMVLLSPPPTAIEKLHADRVLVVSGKWDIPRINAFIPTLVALGAPNVEWRHLDWAGHSTAVVNPWQIRQIARWLNGHTETMRTGQRLTWIVLLLISSTGLGITLLRGSAVVPARPTVHLSLLAYAAAGIISLCALRLVGVPAWFRLFSVNYAIGFLMIMGLLLVIARRAGLDGANPNLRVQFQGRVAVHALACFVYVAGVMGTAGSHLLHLVPSDGRLWRFLLIAAAGFPLFLMDEITFRKIYPRWKSVTLGIVTRILIGAFITSGVLILNPEYAFLVIVIHLVVLFWILLWFATGIVHRHTQNAVAAAVFAALVQGWLFAAVFVIV